MARKTAGPKVLTANRLLDGEVVWLGRDGQWHDVMTAPLVALSPEDQDALSGRGAQAEAAQHVVGAYLMDVHILDDGGVLPATARERIRCAGPTVRQDLGKQADTARPAARSLAA